MKSRFLGPISLPKAIHGLATNEIQTVYIYSPAYLIEWPVGPELQWQTVKNQILCGNSIKIFWFSLGLWGARSLI